jgi:DNA polymerase III delta prime subunit
MAHAYVLADESERGIETAANFAESTFDIARHQDSADFIVLRYGLFSVEDARKLSELACNAPTGAHKVIVVTATRLFHEAQNALLKLFEEPPAATTLILIVPSEGMLIPTLRSRLAQLPRQPDIKDKATPSSLGETFLKASAEEREKLVTKLVDRSKADKDEEKQRARSEAIALAEDLLRAAEAVRVANRSVGREDDTLAFQKDLMAFMPLLHTRSAPLKLIFEHLLLVIPKELNMAEV